MKIPRGLKGKILNAIELLLEPMPFPAFITMEALKAEPDQIKAAVMELVANGKVKPVQHAGAMCAWPIGKPLPNATAPATSAPPASPATNPPSMNGTNHAPAPPPTTAPQGYIRPARLPSDLRESVRQCWEEFAFVASKWSREQAGNVWKIGIMDKYLGKDGGFTERDLTDAHLAEIEQMLVAKIADHYEKAGTPNANPFCAAAGT